MASVPGKENSSVTHRANGVMMRRWKWSLVVVSPVGGGIPVILGGGGDVLQYRGRRGKVRRGPFDEEKVAKTELTKGGSWRWRWPSGD
jgi:hypothetical protein